MRDQESQCDGHDGCDKSCQLETVVDDVPTDARGAGSVKIDGCHLGGIVGHEEITVAGREHRQQV